MSDDACGSIFGTIGAAFGAAAMPSAPISNRAVVKRIVFRPLRGRPVASSLPSQFRWDAICMALAQVSGCERHGMTVGDDPISPSSNKR